jgi:chemotaxis protein MotA
VDLATILGLALSAILIALAVALGGSVDAYFDPASLLIVLGGVGAATLVAFPWEKVRRLPAVICRTLWHRAPDPIALIDQMMQYAEIARREGILALEERVAEVDDPFIVSGIQMAVDGADPEVIQQALETELDQLVERHDSGRAMLETIGRFAPAFGMIGTLIGLVTMLRSMDDPASIGAAMAVALLTTLYGAILAYMIALPMAEKLARRSSEEIMCKLIIIRGVMSIQAGDNPRHLQAKLLTFVPPALRANGLRKAA